MLARLVAINLLVNDINCQQTGYVKDFLKCCYLATGSRIQREHVSNSARFHERVVLTVFVSKVE